MLNADDRWLLVVAAAWYGAVNFAALCVFVWDKRAAEREAWRVSERTLLGLVWLGGFAGAWVAMRLVRHKTRKWLFRLSPWAAGVVHLGVGAWVLLPWAVGRG